MAGELVKKLAEVVKEVGRVEKRGHNDFQNYDYVTESDMVDALRNELAKRGIISVPYVDKCELVKIEKGFLATLEVQYKFTDGVESQTVRVVGSGTDNPGDKAVYKAMTGAEKYALKQLFLIPTGDDPERDEDDNRASRGPGKPIVEKAPSDSAPKAPRKEAASGSASADEKDRTVAFGPNKGKTLDGLDEKDLAAWTKTCEEIVAKNDPKWGKINKQRLEACKAEWNKRLPWRGYWERIKEIGFAHGLNEEQIQVTLKDGLGVTSADKLEEDDPAHFEEWVEKLEEKGRK